MNVYHILPQSIAKVIPYYLNIPKTPQFSFDSTFYLRLMRLIVTFTPTLNFGHACGICESALMSIPQVSKISNMRVPVKYLFFMLESPELATL